MPYPSLRPDESFLPLCVVYGLHCALPDRFRLSDTWRRLYSTAACGTSLATMMRNVGSAAPLLVACRVSTGGAVGFFTASSFSSHAPSSRATGAFGGGEKFVWRCGADATGGGVKVYPLLPEWVGNAVVTADTRDGLGMGGSGSYALWLETSLLAGRSSACHNFGSPPLAAGATAADGDDDSVILQFTSVEVWTTADQGAEATELCPAHGCYAPPLAAEQHREAICGHSPAALRVEADAARARERETEGFELVDSHE